MFYYILQYPIKLQVIGSVISFRGILLLSERSDVMRAVGEFCVHPGQGACFIEDMVLEPVRSYVLSPIGQKHPIQIVFPLEQEYRLRDVISQQEALQLVDSYPTIELDTFHVNNASLEESHFRAAIREGLCKDSMSIAKTFRARIEQARTLNKKPPVSHERIFKMATHRYLYELITALGWTVDDIRTVFSSRYGVEIGKA